MFVSKQRAMLETKVEYRGAQKERTTSLRKKTSMEDKITVSDMFIHCNASLSSAFSDYQCTTHTLYSRL